jgi:predicted nucleic acid-binding protein
VIYLDTSAVFKLLVEEEETAALIEWLNAQSGELVSSALIEMELPRAIRRRNEPAAFAAMAEILSTVDRLDIDASVRATAAAYTDPYLRTLDAIHLASADQLLASGMTITAFVTYDKRLLTAAAGIGLPAVSPGT